MLDYSHVGLANRLGVPFIISLVMPSGSMQDMVRQADVLIGLVVCLMGGES